MLHKLKKTSRAGLNASTGRRRLAGHSLPQPWRSIYRIVLERVERHTQEQLHFVQVFICTIDRQCRNGVILETKTKIMRPEIIQLDLPENCSSSAAFVAGSIDSLDERLRYSDVK